MMVFIFSVFDHKYLSWTNLAQKFKNCLFKVKFGTKTKFEYAKFNGGVYFICFRLKIATLFGNFGQKNHNC